MSMVLILELSGNSLTGEIPSSLNEMKKLTTLDLSNNQLSGEIHNHWKGLKQLDTIDLSNNKLSGGIPSSLWSLLLLQLVKLTSNNLSGDLSQSLQNCTHVATLDLKENRFTGNISDWIGERLLSVTILNLRVNLLNGSIPESICHLPELHILDFALNNLSWPIPPCLGNLSGLNSFKPYHVVTNRVVYSQEIELYVKGREVEYTKILHVVNALDLSGNNLKGQIPDGISNLSYIVFLNLSWNQLTGEIPLDIGDLNRLESLDLCRNQLSGPIPSSMPSMTSLNYSNSSYNNLSGPIPSTNQFQTLVDPPIYKGNSGLCGFPLQTQCSAFTPNDEDNEDEGVKDNIGEENDWIEMTFFYAGLVPGFVFGFWSVCGTLIFKKP